MECRLSPRTGRVDSLLRRELAALGIEPIRPRPHAAAPSRPGEPRNPLALCISMQGDPTQKDPALF